MCVDLVLDRNSNAAKRSRIEYFSSHGADSLSQLAWQGYYVRFSQGRSLHSIAVDAGRSTTEVLHTYERYFQAEIFKNRPYPDFQKQLATYYMLEKLPEYPLLQYFARKAWENELVVRPIAAADHPNRINKTTVLIDDKRCRIHALKPHRGNELILAPLERGHVEQVGLVLCNPDPGRTQLIPADVVMRMRKIRGGTHVSVDPRKIYDGATLLAA